MPPDPPTPPEQTGLVLQRGAGLATLPHGNSPALSEIINRSLVHLRTSQSLATRHRDPGEEREFEIARGVMMRMCWIPPGEFLMGSPEDELGRRENETQHRVTITQGFWLGKYQVNQAQ
jgi:formylglycine-generating enzyme required for sulfatase activity